LSAIDCRGAMSLGLCRNHNLRRSGDLRLRAPLAAGFALITAFAFGAPAEAAKVAGQRDLKLCDDGIVLATIDDKADVSKHMAACLRGARVNPFVQGILITQRANMRKLRGDLDGAIKDFDVLDSLIGRGDALTFSINFMIENSFLAKAQQQAEELEALEHSARSSEFLGDVYARERDWTAALSAYEQASRLEPTKALYLIRQADVLDRMGRIEEAIAQLDRAIILDRTSYKATIEKAEILVRQGHADQGISLLTDVLRADPRNKSALNLRGFFFAEQKDDLERAIADWDESIRVNPAIWGPYYMKGLALAQRQRYIEALPLMDKAISLWTFNADGFSGRGRVRRLAGDLEGAIKDLDKAVLIAPRSAVALGNRGDARRQRGDLTGSLRDFDLALSVAPEFAPGLTGRGLTLERMGRLDEARRDFQAAVDLPKERLLEDIQRQDVETAKARLAALSSGAPQPTILPSPGKSGEVIPTPNVLPPQPPAMMVGAGKRVALVIGNSHYRNVGALPNPEKDASALAASLKNVGFSSVTLVTDVTRESLAQALRAFAAEADAADWAVVYYAGHGVEVGGVNYLVPVDAKLAVDRDVQFEAIPLDQIMAAVEQTKKLKLILLDACRNNPFIPQMQRTAAAEPAQRGTGGATIGTRSVGRGLGDINPGGGTLVVYAAKHGQLALDGEGANSPFVVALLQRLATPGVDITKIFRLVRDDVMEMTAGRQEPYTYGSISGREDFYFVAK
jgi:tetratricopeptide (TPR) repeat protein